MSDIITTPVHARTDEQKQVAASRFEYNTRDNGTYQATIVDWFLEDGGKGQKAWLTRTGLIASVSQATLSHWCQVARVITEVAPKRTVVNKQDVYDDLFGALVAVKMGTLEGRKPLGMLTEEAVKALLREAKNVKGNKSLADRFLAVEAETFEARLTAHQAADEKGKRAKRGARPNDGTKGEKGEGAGQKAGDTITLSQQADALSRALTNASEAEVRKAETALANLTALLVEMGAAGN